MSLRLILMRHAKSDWHTPASGDFERPLNGRGQKSATAIGQWLASKEYVPDLVLCSAATRTRQTWQLVKEASGADPMVGFSQPLYLASPDTMFQEITGVQAAQTVMMIAHNPGSAMLASALAIRAPAHTRFDAYPTAATTVFEFEIDGWASLEPGSGQVVDFTVPRDLTTN